MGAQWKAKGKDLAANARGKMFTKLVKEITVAARNGADPASNARLRLVVEQARKVSMPKDTLDRALKKGSGVGDEATQYERVMYEGYAPHQVAVMVECLTDNVKRTAPEMRVLFRKGQLGTSGSVAWDFDHLGMIEAAPATPGADAETAAIEAGAEDLEPGEDAGNTLFLTAPADLDLVSRARLQRAVHEAGLQAQEPGGPHQPECRSAGRGGSLPGGHRCARRRARGVRGLGGVNSPHGRPLRVASCPPRGLSRLGAARRRYLAPTVAHCVWRLVRACLAIGRFWSGAGRCQRSTAA
jgi:YebC/PmpR family DNA-binding regulatory protein